MKPTFHIFTTCNLTYLPQSLLLLRSIRHFHDDCKVTLVLVEEKRLFPKAVQIRLDEFDDVLFPEDLWGGDRFQILFSYDVVEACTAIKGPALSLLLEEGIPVVYLDPDIALFSRIDPVLELLADASIVLTPHQLFGVDPSVYGELHDERMSLVTGVFNFGFLAVRPDDEGLAFSKWWSFRTTFYAFDNSEVGLFTDQKWGNLVPALFNRVAISRNKGLNVASWNIHERQLALSDDGDYVIDDEKLIFFHFTKAESGLQPILQKAISNNNVASIWRWYLEILNEERRSLPQFEWSYRRYMNESSEIIEKIDRREYRNIGDPRPKSKSENPFSGPRQ